MKARIEIISDDGTVLYGEVELKKRNSSTERAPAHRSKKSPTRHGRIGCPEALRLLWQAGLFRTAVPLGKIKEALNGQGYNFPDNTLMIALASSAFLTRRGSRGAYTWSQRYPFSE